MNNYNPTDDIDETAACLEYILDLLAALTSDLNDSNTHSEWEEHITNTTKGIQEQVDMALEHLKPILKHADSPPFTADPDDVGTCVAAVLRYPSADACARDSARALFRHLDGHTNYHRS